MASLLTNIKSPKTLIKNARTNFFPLDIISQCLNMALYEASFGLDKVLDKIMYENPENPNGLIIDGNYTNGEPIFNKSDPNSIHKRFGYNHLKFINMNGSNGCIYLDNKTSINGWTFNFEAEGLDNRLVIYDPKYLKNCVLTGNVVIKFNILNKNYHLKIYGNQYGVDNFLDFLRERISEDTVKFNGWHNCGIEIPKKMVQYLKNIKEWQNLFYNKLPTPYKFVLGK